MTPTEVYELTTQGGDVTQGKLWAYSDTGRRFSERKKDELDLIRLAEAYPHLKARYSRSLIE